MTELLEETANMLRGMCFDPRIPADTKEALRSRVAQLDAATEASESETGDTDGAILKHMLTWAYGKLHSREFSKQEDALELDRLKLYVEHGALG